MKSLGGLSLAIFPPQVSSVAGSGPEPSASAEFYDLWEGGCRAHFWLEDRRAYDLLQQALRLAPRDLDSSLLADIHEKLNWVRESLTAAEREVIAQYAAVKADPEDAEKHFYLGFTLGRLGRQEEALAEYQAALRNPERLCAHCFRDSWNNIGWYYCRQGQYREALKWFERVCNLNDTSEFLMNSLQIFNDTSHGWWFSNCGLVRFPRVHIPTASRRAGPWLSTHIAKSTTYLSRNAWMRHPQIQARRYICRWNSVRGKVRGPCG